MGKLANFLWPSSIAILSLPEGKSHSKSHSTTIFLWFSYGFPMAFLWFSSFLIFDIPWHCTLAVKKKNWGYGPSWEHPHRAEMQNVIIQYHILYCIVIYIYICICIYIYIYIVHSLYLLIYIYIHVNTCQYMTIYDNMIHSFSPSLQRLHCSHKMLNYLN